MRLLSRSGVSPVLLLTCLTLAANVTAQGLPKLPGSNDNNAASSGGSAAASSQADTASATGSASGSGSGSNTGSATQTGKPSGTSSGSSLPAITTKSDQPGLTGLPKLAGDDYPPPSVPPTADAPFMQHSTLPEGTVFIAVGAALGFIGMLVIAWRGLVAWSIHRSVKKAAIAHSSKYSHGRDPRAGLASKSDFFAPNTASSLTLDHLAPSGKGGISKNPSAHNSLFFSPTAGAGMQGPNNRGSGYLPAGYYASGGQAPSGMTHVGGGGGVPMSNLNNARESRRYSRNPSPPGTPSLPPSRGGPPESPYNGRTSMQALVNQASSSSLNLSAPAPGRAPSAYLEDLFENHPPGSFPPEEHPRESKRYSRH